MDTLEHVRFMTKTRVLCTFTNIAQKFESKWKSFVTLLDPPLNLVYVIP